MELVNYLALGIGSVGILIILWGALTTLVELSILEFKRLFGHNPTEQRTRIRHNFSSYLLMGLEYMIGADIIRTIVRPSLQELAILGGLVAIRTVISYFLNQEIEQKD